MSKSTLSNGEEVERIEGAEHAKITKLFRAYETGNVRLGKQRYFYPVEFLKYAEEYLNFQVSMNRFFSNVFSPSFSNYVEFVWNDIILNISIATCDCVTPFPRSKHPLPPHLKLFHIPLSHPPSFPPYVHGS